MELIEKNGPYLCLNMIVKNEGHIIKDTLTKLLKKVPEIDYWVISDTGSTDKTKEIISDFFKERNINGELFDDEWKDFGHNRTLALEHAFGKSKYLLVFDADDEICGDFVLPNLVLDSYNFQFGDANGTSYIRTQIINNKKKWKYVGVLHEIITCSEQTNGMDIIKGKYYTISGKSGSRSQDQNKYQKDALVLEKAYEEAVKNNDGLYNRYGFYCANSYYDSGKWVDAIKWYKITLGNKNWDQEKYVACHRLHNCYSALNQKETGLYYLVKSFSYDKERAECLYELISYYCCNNMNDVAYSYYNIVKSFYNEKYLKHGLNDKLFLDVSKANLFLPFYMILVSDKVQDHDTTIQMYRIIFTKKHIERSKHFIGNMLYNLQFFIERVKDDSEFLRLFQEYVKFLVSIEYPVYDHDFMVKYEKYGINVPKFSESVFSLDDCLKSKNILLYSGYSPFKWNYTFSINNALGGSETAITCLTKNFPKDYTIYVVGEVEEETVENMRYVHFNNLKNLIKTTAFHTIIVSRYLNFYELYRNFSAYQTFIWGHDITLYAYGTDLSVEGILSKWASKITGCICQTEWHKNLFLSSFPQLKDKITTINNGINIDLFNLRDMSKLKKVINRFIYTSCSERGLYKLVQLWPSILENLPDAELLISSYNNFPKSEEDVKILEIINKTPSIKHMGKLNRTELYNLMASAEYWLYPSYFQETSCITSLELLASEVICLYYPIAGLVNTVGDYGIQISEGNEIDALLSLSIKKKNELKRKGKEYALSCSWQNRVIEWSKLLFLQNLSIIEKRMFDLYETISMPQAHTNILKKISETFTPNVIYDIGASTLHWTKAAKNIWSNSEFCAFDAIEEAEKLYKSKNIKYNIGVISDQDNKIVKFYENKENPAGNSYYKEIGHPNSVNVYPENSYIERKSMTLETVVKCNNFLLPDLVKIDVQGAELDILKGGQTIINNAKYLIIELQNVEYNRGAPLENVTIEYLQSNGWEIVEAKFSNNGPDADYLFINTNYRADKILNNDYIIKIINLERRSDRKNLMASKLSEQNITNYEFFKAVDGNLLEPSSHIQNLFKNNDFNYRKGIIGCALSHYTNWNNLINDNKNSYYVILEDDIKLTSNFNILLDKCISIIKSQNIEYALIGGNQIKEEFGSDDNIVFSKITEPICSGAYGYIISKKACIKLVNYLNKNGINRAIDHSDLYTTCLDMYRINKYLVTTRAYQIHGETDTDIQLDYNCLIFDSVPTYTVSFVDWWSEEYCGGIFDNQNNYFTNLLRDYYNVQIVEPNQKPDILFYSVFGNNHLTLNAGRKVFYSGESISQDNMADFNITFDNDNYNNCRLPLWICYLNDTIINDYNNKIQNKIAVPQKSKFCSIISQQDNVSNTRSEIVNKLSKYKRVDCGGKFLNNIGYVVPRGINCSGKIEHNNNYKFVIAFENKDYPGYVTEKICDAYKSKCIPIYWGTKDVVKDFNPSTFINANNFANLDELVKYIIKVDNDDKWYASFFKDPIFSNKWLDTFNDINKTFYKNLADRIIGKNNLLYTKYLNISNPLKRKNICVIHNCNLKDIGIKRLEHLINHINKSKLIKKLEKIYINNIGIPILENNYGKKYDICNYSSNVQLWEHPTINKLKELSENINNYNILYLHSKGITHDYGKKCINDWIDMMVHFLIYNHDICIEQLNNGYQAVGCNYTTHLSYAPSHFSGNFWWGDSEYIKQLPLLDSDALNFENRFKNNRWDAEFWICKNNPRVFEIHNSNTDHYTKEYPIEKYCKKNINTLIEEISIYNIWHNKLFDKCYDKLDDYSLQKITMYDVNKKYSKEYNKERKYNIVSEYKLDHYNSLYQDTNYCQTSCLYHVFKNKLYTKTNYIGFIQYDMELYSDFIYDIEKKINQSESDTYFYSLTVANKVEVNYICKPYDNSILEKYNNYFNTSHTYESIKAHHKADKFICLHTFVIPTKTFINMMTWYCTITDWLHKNYINGLYSESISEVTEEIFGLFLLLQIIENDNIQLEELKLHHEWPNLHNQTEWINYKVRTPENIQSININNKEKWVVYGPEHTYTLIKEYINNLNLRYCVKYVTNIKEIETINPSKILFINNIHDNSVFNVFKNIEISILNIDSMYIPNFFNDILEMISLYPNIKIYDYSLKNIEVLQKYNIRTEFLEYIYDEKEINSLKEINNQAKTYDFGIICYYKDVRCSYRRKHIVELLRSKGYTVNIACGFDRERDIDLGKCKIILNIHSKSFDIECRTFEHLRCNRLLYAGFKILSEVSYIDDDFISKYKENIKFIKYDDFENITRENIDKFNFISAKNNDYNCQKEIGIFNYESSRVDYKIEFGLDDNKIDITYKVIALSLNKEFIEIPTDDVLRAELYGDPCWGVVKSIYITTKDGSVTKCKDNHPIILDWNGILIKNPNFKYKLSACLLIKNETENLNDWIEHYINEGVEHFFITSNNSTDGIDNFILNSEYKNMITLITDNSDINIYNDQVKHREILCKNFYNIIRNSTEWCILVDIDEFMYGKNGYTLSSFIDTLDQDIGCFYVYWNIFKPTLDSENNISDKFSLKKSCKRINLDLISDLSYEIKFVSKFGKSIFRTSMLQDHTQLWIHKVSTSGKIITNYGNITDYKYDNADDIYWSELNYTKVNVALNHYAIRNKKDYNNKLSQLENTHRYPFVKGLLDICELDNKYIIEDRNILNL